jgi:hypothetical protein
MNQVCSAVCNFDDRERVVVASTTTAARQARRAA